MGIQRNKGVFQWVEREVFIQEQEKDYVGMRLRGDSLCGKTVNKNCV